MEQLETIIPALIFAAIVGWMLRDKIKQFINRKK